MLEGFEDELYENGYRPKPIYREYPVDELNSRYKESQAFFSPGTIQVYAGAQQILNADHIEWEALLMRHLHGDFGDTDAGDWRLNLTALELKQGLILSRYYLPAGHVDITTDLDQQVTKIT
jgi:hypothetical protein